LVGLFCTLVSKISSIVANPELIFDAFPGRKKRYCHHLKKQLKSGHSILIVLAREFLQMTV